MTDRILHDFSIYTDAAREVVYLARSAPRQLRQNTGMDANHVLLGLIRQGSNRASAALADVGITETIVLYHIAGHRGPFVAEDRDSGTPLEAPGGYAALQAAGQAARDAGNNSISPEHLLLGVMEGIRDNSSVLADLDDHRLGVLTDSLGKPCPAAPGAGPLEQLRALATKLSSQSSSNYKDEWGPGYDAGARDAGRQLTALLDSL